MRQGQQNKRMRGRNRGKGPNPLTRSYESNGGDVKIRGTALHVAEKYVQLARDAQASGDRVASENYLQHAEHYYRIVAAAQAQMPQPQPVYRNDEEGDDEEGQDNRNAFGGNPNYGNPNPNQSGNNFQGSFGGNRQPMQGGQAGATMPAGQEQPQPYVNGANGGGQDQPQPDDDQPSGEFRGGGDFRGGEQQRSEGYDNRGHGGGNYRHRRRRPYRDHYNDRGGDQRGGDQRGGGGGGGGGPEPFDAGPRGDE
jgi:hypothetical protein